MMVNVVTAYWLYLKTIRTHSADPLSRVRPRVRPHSPVSWNENLSELVAPLRSRTSSTLVARLPTRTSIFCSGRPCYCRSREDARSSTKMVQTRTKDTIRGTC